MQVAFGKRLKAARGDTPQSVLATALGVTRSSISNIENGRHRIFLDQVFALAAALKVDVADLLPSPADISAEPQIHASGISVDRLSSLPALFEKLRSLTEESSRSTNASP